MLNDKQRDLVVENMGLVSFVLKKYITIDPQRWEYAFDELYQVGYEGLCIAAANYDVHKDCSYWHYAEVVVRNHLYRYCRKLNHWENVPLEMQADALANHDDAIEILIEQIVLSSLDIEKYNGVTRKGMEALTLRNMGYSGQEIAWHYNVPANYISAWIARARKALRQELQIS